jgi:putative oxygen-independent coproporphyrinogen III oxidase
VNESRIPPLSLYLHLPWCVSKCPYCDFNSHTAGDRAPRGRYLEAVETDLGREAGRAGKRPLVSVFIGGGTPSFFTGQEIGQLLDVVAAKFSLQPDIEVTMEANPGTLEHGDLADYALAGVNRLSLGAQSFAAESLQRIGRMHGPDEIYSAYEAAVSAGFDSINLDLMFALPGQSAEMAVSDISEATALGPGHISYYQLTLEPDTVFNSNPPPDLPDEDKAFTIQARCQEILAEQGYEQYEISAFARPKSRCRHNLNYWMFGDYVAAGAGAHGKVTESGIIRRYEKPRHPLTYIEQAESGSIGDREREIADVDIPFEFMLNALRLPGGFEASDYTSRTGLPIETVAGGLASAEARGMIESGKGPSWRPTALGLRFHNDLTAIFLP